jgi:hypothetical protein
MAKKLDFRKKPATGGRGGRKKGSSVDFPFGANVAGKKRRGGFGGGS